MEQEKLTNILSRASKLDDNKRGTLTDEELNEWNERKAMDTVKRLKRNVLGFLGHPFTFGVYISKTTKSLAELSESLMSIGVCDSKSEGEEIAKSLVQYKELAYAFERTLRFEEVKDRNGKEQIRISAHYYGEY